MQTANVTITLDTTVQPSDVMSDTTNQLTDDTLSTTLTDKNTLNTETTMISLTSSTSIPTTPLETMIHSSINSSISTTSIQSHNLNDTNIINNGLTSSLSSVLSSLSSSINHSHNRIQFPSTQIIYSTTIPSNSQSTTSTSSKIPTSSSSLLSSEIRQNSRVSVIMITTTVSPSSTYGMSSNTDSSSKESVVTQTLTITPSLSPLFSISTGSTRDYLIYTQEYLFTDSDTTFTTGLLQTTTMKKSASGITLPTGIVTKPVSYYKAYVDGSLDSGGSTSSTSGHHKSVIIGSVVGSVLGAAILLLLGVLYYMFIRNKRSNNGKFTPSGKQSDLYMDDTMVNDITMNNEKSGDPFKNEFQFNERVPGQIPVPEDPLDYSVSMRDSSDFQFNPESSIDMISNENNGSYEVNSNAYSYTRSITDWRNDTHL
ncbi:Chitinase 3 [Maudiozyma exigua]|uniref:Chitinase 3 n=1 Tax=Maudiozyma exigua TaxID=34358 RepID=A0A9P7B285_MAUEX|nr:Chitinase 3 [Kazachstania exigua]